MEIDFVNEWTDGIPSFSQYTLVDISAEVIDLTTFKQRTVSFVIMGLGFRLFLSNHDTSI